MTNTLRQEARFPKRVKKAKYSLRAYIVRFAPESGLKSDIAWRSVWCARLIVETDEHRGFVERLSFGHDRIGREGFIVPAHRDAVHDDLIVGYSGVLTHHR